MARAQKPSRASRVFAFLGLGLGLLYFGFLAVIAWSELLTRSFEWDALVSVLVMTGVTVGLAYPFVALVALRRDFRWRHDGVRAFSIAAAFLAPMLLILAGEIIADHGADLGQIITQRLPSRTGAQYTVRWPAWCSLVMDVFFAAFVTIITVSTWRLSRRASGTPHAASDA